MLIHLIGPAGQYHLAPHGVSVAEGNRLHFYDVASALRFLDQFRHDPMAMQRLRDLHQQLSPIGRIKAALDDNALLQELAQRLSKGGMSAFELENESQRTWHAGAMSSSTLLTPVVEPQPRPISLEESRRWAEAFETKPVPEQKYKIVVEVAGKNLVPLLGHLELRRTPDGEDGGHKLSFHQLSQSKGASDAHRVVLCCENVPNQARLLFYVIGDCHLPLCPDIAPVVREAEAQQWGNLLIPFMPVRHVKTGGEPPPGNHSPANDSHGATPAFQLLPPGWLYVYLNGYLWRELQTGLTDRVLRDVNLARQAGKHPRQPEGPPTHVVLVPHQLNGVTQTVQLAYSHQQWDWSQMLQAGGIKPGDPRFPKPIKATGSSTPADSMSTGVQLITLDLSSYHQGFQDVIDAQGFRLNPVATAPAIMQQAQADSPAMDQLARYRGLNIPVVGLTLNAEPNLQISLSYTDVESTPATEIPYIVRFSNGETREGVLDKKGNAVEKDVPQCGGDIEFCYKDSLEDIKNDLASFYDELNTELTRVAQSIGDRIVKAFANAKPLSKKDQIKADFAKAVREKIEELKIQAQAYDDLAWYEKSWENIKATGAGLGGGVTEYIPDLGEFGDLIDKMQIDVTTIIGAIATGDITQLENDFKAWRKNAGQGYEEASQTMEILIVLLSDSQTRALLASLPKKFLEVAPTDQLVELAVSQGTQHSIDGVAVFAVTAGGTLISGPGGAVAGAATVTVTGARKAAKALQAVTDILMSMAKSLKIKRNKRTGGNLGDNKTPLIDGSNKDKKSEDGPDSVTPEITVGDAGKMDKAFFDSKAEDYFYPAKIMLRIKEKGTKKYNGKGTLKITSSQGAFYENESCTKPVNDLGFSASELRQGKMLFTKAAELNNINLSLTLDKQQAIEVKGPAIETVPVEPVNVIYPMIEKEPDINNNGPIEDFVALVGGAKQYNIEADGKTTHAMTYVEIWLEESNKKYPFKVDGVSVTSKPDNIVFYKDAKGKEEYELGALIEYKDLDVATNKTYHNEYPKNEQYTVKSKKFRLYLAAKALKENYKRVRIIVKVEGEANKSFRIDKENATLKRTAEDFDGLLMKETFEKAKDLVDSNSAENLNMNMVAFARAGVHKRGHKTIAASTDQVNVEKEIIDEARNLIYAENEYGYLETAGGGQPREEFGEDSRKLYFKLFKDGSGQKIHPITKKLIMDRINQIIPKDGEPQLEGGKDYNVGHKAPGFHAEVLAVNQILNTYFRKEKDPSVLNKISVATYKIQGKKDKKIEKPRKFKACSNCEAILNKVRITTDPKVDK